MDTVKRVNTGTKFAATRTAGKPRATAVPKRRISAELVLEGIPAQAYQEMRKREKLSEEEMLRCILKDGIRAWIESCHPKIHAKYSLNQIMEN